MGKPSKENEELLTQEELKELLHYDPDTGGFTRKVSESNRVKVGDVAGWRSEGYIRMRVRGKFYFAHRLAFLYMTGEWPEDQIDHINHIRDDNRWCNLREVSNQENHKNKPKRKDNTSGVTGVCWDKTNKKWWAQIKAEGKVKNLGCFTSKEDAIKARKEAEIKYGFHDNHGDKR